MPKAQTQANHSQAHEDGATGTAVATDSAVEAAPADWRGHVPAPRRSDDDRQRALEVMDALDSLDTPLARIVLDRARVRAAVALDMVTFTARCPACGEDCEWLQERQDTRVRSSMNCTCRV